jgi:hypothetical protein
MIMTGLLFLIIRIALAASLYLFLGWALLTLWQDLKRQASLTATRQPPHLTLAYQSDEGAHPYRFTIPEIAIGRDPACDLPVDNITVSAKHARLVFRQAQWWLEDLRSTNGTFLNQERITAPVVLTSGDHIRCGQARFILLIGESEPVVPTDLGGAS